MIYKLVLKQDDRFPKLFNLIRYVKHVILQQSMVYPNVLGPILEIESKTSIIAIDAGANKGIFTRFLSKYFSTIHAVEPLSHLARRLSAMGITGVCVSNCALGMNDGVIEIRTPLNTAGDPVDALTTASEDNHFELFGHTQYQTLKVPMHRLDSLVTSKDRVGFIKIDVEGFENSVISGAVSVIERDYPVILIEISSQHNPSYMDVIVFLAKRQYHGFSITNLGLYDRMLTDISSQPTSIGGNKQSAQWDFLFIPEKRMVDYQKFVQRVLK